MKDLRSKAVPQSCETVEVAVQQTEQRERPTGSPAGVQRQRASGIEQTECGVDTNPPAPKRARRSLELTPSRPATTSCTGSSPLVKVRC